MSSWLVLKRTVSASN